MTDWFIFLGLWSIGALTMFGLLSLGSAIKDAARILAERKRP